MDTIIKVPRSFLNTIRGFLNVFAQQCANCLKSKPISCVGCLYGRAKDLIRQLDSIKNVEEEKYFVANPVEERQRIIIKAINQAGRPLLSREIRVPGITRHLKKWTLKEMCRRHILKSLVDRDGHYRYSIHKGMPKRPY